MSACSLRVRVLRAHTQGRAYGLTETHRHMYALACTHGCTYPPAIYFMWNYLFRQSEGGGPETNRISRGVWTVTVMTKILSLVLSGHAEVRTIPLNVGVICFVRAGAGSVSPLSVFCASMSLFFCCNFSLCNIWTYVHMMTSQSEIVFGPWERHSESDVCLLSQTAAAQIAWTRSR